MVTSTASRTLDLPVAVAFDRLTALQNHERLIPLTAVEAPRRRPQVGDIVVATSAALLRDTMELVTYEPPVSNAVGRAVWVKRGPVLLGEAEIVISRLSDTACRADWIERDIRFVGLPWSAPPVTALIGVMTRAALARFDRLTRSR